MERPIHLLHGSRLELLAEHLADTLAAAPLADPLATETIVVPHPGMGRWLQQFLAQRWGIAACLALDLPGKFIWEAARAVVGELPAQSGYERDALEWRLFALLRADGSLARRAPVLRRFLAGGDPLMAYELAQRLADAFDQYMVYRPGWLDRWERGEEAVAHRHEPWQRAAWRAIRGEVGEPHRAAVLRDVASRLERATPGDAVALKLPPRIAVFGVSAMPPLHVEFFGALARHVELRWYQLDPSAEWWVEGVTRRERGRIVARLAAQGIAESEGHLEETHPLLTAWGKVGRDTLRALYALPLVDDIVAAPAPRPPRSAADAVAPGTTLDLFEPEPAPASEPSPSDAMLAWLHRTWELLDPELAPPSRVDASLRVHGCASRMREVELLHDALLERIEADPSLTPRDIVVMTPRLAEYAPLVDAVFGAAPEPRRIPYTIADRPARGTHPILRTFELLVALPLSRLPASEIGDLLDVDAIARRFGLDGEARDGVSRWIEALRIRWGLDADDRERAGAGRWNDYGWRQGLDRLVLGYAVGGAEAGGGVVAAAEALVAPYPHVEGHRAATAGALARFVERLADWRTRLASPRTALAWQDALTTLVAEFHDTIGADADEAAALATIYDAIGGIVDAARRAGQAELPIAHAVVRAAIAGRLADPERYQRFLAHGTTVCAMVPMRNVPFRIVCLLGLDDADFPRREPEPSFHLMRSFPAPGDRTRQDDDRYLFLEALLAARDAVHVSHVALNARDGSTRPPSTVVLELLDFIVRAYPDARQAEVRRALYLGHAAAPFDPRQYAPESALRSFDPDWVEAAAATRAPRESPAPFAATVDAPSLPGGAEPDAGDDDAPAPVEIALDDLLAFYRDPPKHYTRRVLELELARFDAPPDDEPHASDGLERYGIDDALLRALLADPETGDEPLVAMLRARTLLRPGHAGERDARDRLACVRRVVSTYRALFPGAVPRTVPVDRATRHWRVTGEIEQVHAGGPVRVRAGVARGGDWVGLALAARLGGYDSAWLIGIERSAPFARRLDALRLDAAWLDRAISWYLQERIGFVPLLRKASWVYSESAEGQPVKAAQRARDCIRPSHDGGQGAEGEEPSVALLLRGREDTFDTSFELAAQSVLVPVRAAIDDGSSA